MRSIGWEGVDLLSLQASLSTTFLGATEIVWFGDVSVLDGATRTWALDFLSQYNGPHTIMCAVKPQDLPKETKADVIECSEMFQKADIEELFQYLWARPAEPFLNSIGLSFKTLSLDSLVLLGMYTTLLGAHTEEFMRTWFEKIVLPEESLFSLAQFFFARKKDHFFRAWLAVKDDHVVPFWTTFWSEQVWRAYHVITFRKQGDFVRAKQMSVRLPFSFLQRDWQTVSCKELNNAHDFLYGVDCRIKSGGSDNGLELFFDAFMSKEFQT